MKTKFIVPFVLLCFLMSSLNGQEITRKFYYYVEGGIDFIGCEAPEKDYIRGDVDPYYYDNVTDNLRALLYKSYAGAKMERRVWNDKIGILAGIRYTMVENSVGKTSYWSDSPDFFYLQVSPSENNTITEYYKVTEIIQRSHYIGIPLEMRIYPYEDRVFNLYFKIGASFNFSISDNTNVVFFNADMGQYEDEVADIIEEPYAFYSSLYAAAGLKIGRQTKPGVNFEFCVPAFMITTGSSGLVNPTTGCGFQLNIRLPF
ncbi:MAG: outer membrane beta-barrel protein [Bacteroidales bacterium]|nr:outer membrane beta-barrel protein [Bacteroidales bacterium]